MRVLENVLLKDYSSIKIGGVARKVFFPSSKEDVLEVLKFRPDVFVLGKCSNIIFPEGFIDRDFMIFGNDFSNVIIEKNIVFAEAGASMRKVSQAALDASLTGLEFMDGIPGSIGGGVYMNAGAYGTEMKDVILEVLAIRDGEIISYKNEDLNFGVRKSIFQSNGDIIISASFKAEPGNYEEIDLLIRDLNNRRKEKQPLNLHSCGSVFKRPKDGFASKMIDEAGLKGMRVGDIQVSEKHAGFIVNLGNATKDDFLGLVDIIRNRVFKEFGVMLELEVRIFGE